MAKNTLNLNSGSRTHEGSPARHISSELQLRRSVLACLLWESQFYEDAVEIRGRIAELVPKVAAEKVAAFAVEAREKMKLRHAPLLLVREMARHKTHRAPVSETLARIVQRADELTEFVRPLDDACERLGNRSAMGLVARHLADEQKRRVAQLHLLASLDGERRHLLGCDLWHQLGDTAADLDSVLVKLVLPQQAGEYRAPQLQFGRNVPSRRPFMRARYRGEIECVQSGHSRPPFLHRRGIWRRRYFSDALRLSYLADATTGIEPATFG